MDGVEKALGSAMSQRSSITVPLQGGGSSPRPLGCIEGWRDGAGKGCMKRSKDE